MDFYSDMAETATEMIEEFGQEVVVTRYEIGMADLVTGIVPQSSTEFITKGILLDFDYRNFGEGIDLFTSINRSTKRLLVAPDVVMNAEDSILVDGDIYKIRVMKLVKPAGTRVLYDLWIQR